jgi:hypothetical protein
MLRDRLESIDVQVEKIRLLIEDGSRLDYELGAGLGCTDSLTNIEHKIDAALAVADELDRHIRLLKRR